jgi:hydrogenase maturation protein HypF
VSHADPPRVRTRARVEGTVQGVGFRPFVFRLAHEQDLAGYVLNDEHGVLLEVEGPAPAVARFVDRLKADAPPLAVVDRVSCSAVEPNGEAGFAILESERSGRPDALVSPDTATCADCLVELLDPGDRRHRYPFINCTNCGPRFTIVRGVPYDRPLTTMAPFVMCADCRREYEDPLDRRFHAQPNACSRCGPRVRILDRDGKALPAAGAQDPIEFVALRLAAGAVVAIKGLGGFHLCADASDEAAVGALRARKHREDKPFALMTADVEAARRLVVCGEEEAGELSSSARPIVLAARRRDAPVADAVAPRAAELGIMLPYTPLHHLLIRDFVAAGGRALVMTSGNVADEPIAYRDRDALTRLVAIADLFLVHDREIETRTDDSVLRVVSAGSRRRPLQLRRSRGYVPGHLPLPAEGARPLLACGAEQKSTFCLAKGSRAWISHHIGDLEHFSTLEAFRDGVDHFERLFAVSPEVVAHDLHPDYLSTTYALERDGVDHVGVQHHHSHLAACLAEHGLTGVDAVGAIYDGTGYGTDGTVWGGELLVGGLADFERAGWLLPVRMPGGAAAVRQPWRMAHAWLTKAFGEPQAPTPALAPMVDDRRWEAMDQIGASPYVSPLTSSMGRLFDAVSALCGIAAQVTYEGQGAVELEAAAWAAGSHGAYEIEVGKGWRLDPRAAIRRLVGELRDRGDPGAIAARFHAGVTAATVAAVTGIAGERGLDTAVLSGGVFQNRLLLETTAAGLERAGLRVLIPELLPPNDGGISYGQAAVAAARQHG